MNARMLLAVFSLFAAETVAIAQSRLQIKVITSAAEGFSVNSVLVSGEKDVILIDPQFLLSEAHRLVATILESKKNLTTVYVTHPHPDHYFGLAVIRQAFPNARLVALPACVAGIRGGWEARWKFWKPTYGNNLPDTGPILPEELQDTTLLLEGENLQIFGGVEGDGPNNSYVWIPSIKAVVAGDIVFSGVHFVVPKAHQEWVKTLDQIASLNPAVVVPGHQSAGAKNDASTLTFMKTYMEDFDKAVASSKTAEEVKSKVKSMYPNLGMENLLNAGAQAAFPAKK